MESQSIADDNTGLAVVGAGQHQRIVYSSGYQSDVEDMDNNDDDGGDAKRDADHFGGGKGDTDEGEGNVTIDGKEDFEPDGEFLHDINV